MSKINCQIVGKEQKQVSLLIVFNGVLNRIGGLMVSMFTSSAVDRGFEPWSGQTKYY